MEFHVRLEGRTSLSRQIYAQIRLAIVEGRLKHGERLPSTRELAQRLGIARNTVAVAYEWLTAEGIISGRGGAGSRVQTTTVALPRRRTVVALQYAPVWDSLSPPRRQRVAARFDFGVGMPDASLFPFDVWRRLLARQIHPSRLGSDESDPSGHPELREAIARYVAVSRGVTATSDDVIVTNGAQHAFDLVARLFVGKGSRVALEDPAYPAIANLFRSMSARIAFVPVDDSGLDVSALPADAKLVYVTPAHQFPMGMPMSAERRVALLEWANQRNAVIVEDDYDSEFRFGGRPLETLQAADRNGRVIYVGSFSKSLLPALRLGFLVAPPSVIGALRVAAHVSARFAQWPAQAALASFINEGLLGRHVRKMRRLYAERHERILTTLQRDFEDWLRPRASVSGLHVAATLRCGGVAAERRLTQKAARRGVAFEPLSRYCIRQKHSGVVLGYGGIATEDISEGLRRLSLSFRGD